MNYEYYYNNVPNYGPCRNNLIYTSLISSDKKTFVQWYHNDTAYHQGKNEVVDPDTFTKVWSDRWLQKFATCLIKQQYGTNLKKYGSMPLPGGITFNGQKIYDEATEERKELEDEMINSYSLPVVDMIG